MDADVLYTFLGGVLSGLAFVIGLFFVRYYRVSRDRFFLFLTATFWILGANWGFLATQVDQAEAYFYLPRLFAFLVLLAGIVDKNRRSARAAEAAPRPDVEV